MTSLKGLFYLSFVLVTDNIARMTYCMRHTLGPFYVSLQNRTCAEGMGIYPNGGCRWFIIAVCPLQWGELHSCNSEMFLLVSSTNISSSVPENVCFSFALVFHSCFIAQQPVLIISRALKWTWLSLWPLASWVFVNSQLNWKHAPTQIFAAKAVIFGWLSKLVPFTPAACFRAALSSHLCLRTKLWSVSWLVRLRMWVFLTLCGSCDRCWLTIKACRRASPDVSLLQINTVSFPAATWMCAARSGDITGDGEREEKKASLV